MSNIGITRSALVPNQSVNAVTDLASLDVSGLNLGARVFVVATGCDFQLVVSSATVDHSTVEAVLGVSGLRWVKTSTSSAAQDWAAALDALFVTRTGLSPLQWTRPPIQEFLNKNAGATANGLFNNGTGSSADIVSGVGIGIGVATLQAPTSGTGEAAWAPTIATGATVLTNPRAKRWLLAYRLACAHAPGAASSVVCGGTVNNDIFGVGFGGAQSVWQYVHGNLAATNVTPSLQPIDSTGNVLLTVYVANFDLVNIVFNANYVGGAAEIVGEPVANLPALNWYPSVQMGLGSTAPSDKILLDTAYGAFEI